MRKVLFFILAISLFYHCASKKSSTVDKGTIVVDYDPETLASGKSIYDQNCGKCHELYAPTKHTSEDWVTWVNAMKDKAKISDAQANEVLAYLQTNAKK